MVSIIICSRSSDISSALRDNIKNTIGVDYEIIVMDNSENNYSIFSAYNNGVNQSRFPFLCFIHEDVLFQTNKWGKMLINHLNDKKTGIVGVAGGKFMMKVPAQWSNEGRYINIIQHRKKKTMLLKEPRDFSGISQSAILIDGVFLSMRRELFSEIEFDEKISGFHGYDYDISTQSIVAGYNNYVVYDILLEHFSAGKKDRRYYSNLIDIYLKWRKYLPLFSNDVSEETRSQTEHIEIKRLLRLIRRMAKTDFTTKDIVANTKLFIDIINTKNAKKKIKLIYFIIFFVRLVKSPKYLFK